MAMEAQTSSPRRSQIVVVELIRGNRKEKMTASQEEPAEIVFGYLNPSARANRYLSFRRAAASRRSGAVATAVANISAAVRII